MSAFLVSNLHLDALVAAAIFGPAEVRSNPDRWEPLRLRQEYRPLEPANASAVGLMLLRENEASMQSRYPGRWGTPAEGYTFASDLSKLRRRPALEVLKHIDCYEYQACEHDGWPASEAAMFCTRLREKLICWIPGYEALPWGLI